MNFPFDGVFLELFEDVLGQAGRRIGPQLLSMHAVWRPFSFLPSSVSADRAARLAEGGLVSSEETYRHLAAFKSKHAEIGSLLWEDPWMNEQDVSKLGLPNDVHFYCDTSAYYLLNSPGSGWRDLLRASCSMISCDKVVYCSPSIGSKDVASLETYPSLISHVIISAYDGEGLIVFERRA
ncbi:hypothetical protein [Maricaulis sp.]|uniref:hypothetical protein n=1 Tax=Maricaulis sp. TaxID=1486257 RepID=UPI00262FC7B4|nr:hypothetical protein [Maricaulis sp.]